MDEKTSKRLAGMGVQFSQEIFEQLEVYDLLKFWKVGSRNYPNIIDAWLDDDWLCCEYLQLDGFTKTVRYPVVDPQSITVAILERGLDQAKVKIHELMLVLSDVNAALHEGYSIGSFPNETVSRELMNRVGRAVRDG